MDPDPDEHVYPGKEEMAWGSGVKEDMVKGSTPVAKYNKVSEHARRLIDDESMCSMFCGGKKCKYCTHENWKPEQMAINGLYSEWVTDNILAMARPSNYGFDHFNILNQLVEKGIKTVINLEQPGEHAFCGYGNDDSGFSYNPQRLMAMNMYFYNFAWPDYGIAPMSTLLDIVKVMQFSVSEGKVAVHCHAGLGRTGLLIACYLVFCNRTSAGDAVHYVRSRRPGAIQTGQQVQTVYDFEKHLKPFRTIFPSRIPSESEVSFKHFLNRQSQMLHGFEARRLRHVPKVMYVCCERLLEIAGRGQALLKVRTSASVSPACSTSAIPGLSDFTAHAENKQSLPLGSSSGRSKSLEDLTNSKFKQVLTETQTEGNNKAAAAADKGKDGVRGNIPPVIIVPAKREEEEEDDDDDCIVFGKSDTSVKTWSRCESPTDLESCVDRGVNVHSPTIGDRRTNSVPPTPAISPGPSEQVDTGPESDDTTKQTKRVKKKSMGERLKSWVGKGSSSTAEEHPTKRMNALQVGGNVAAGGHSPTTIACTQVCEALAATECTDDVRTRANTLETRLNETEEVWSELAHETDPKVLSAIIWDWLDQLKEPVLRRQDLTYLMEKSGSPVEVLKHLEKPITHFIEYLAIVVSRLLPQSEDIEARMVERLLSHLTHQVVSLNVTSFTAYQPVHWGEMRSSEASRLMRFFFSLVDELGKSSASSRSR